MPRLIHALTILIFCISCGQKKPLNSETVVEPPATSSECDNMAQNECDMYVAINLEREKAGLPHLVVNRTCATMARDHAVDMVVRQFFSHDSPTETFKQRATRYGLNGGWVGENIARGSTVNETLNQWLNSRGHRANIFNSNYRSTGFGFYQDHWVQCFSSLSEASI